MSLAMDRLQAERSKWRKDHPKDFVAKPDTGNLLQWECQIPGREKTPWAGKLYSVRLTFSPSYPLEPPIAMFHPVLFHPNIFENGQVCLSILDRHKEYRPSITISQILIGLQDLLCNPNILSPANTAAATLFHKNPKAYLKKIEAQPGEVMDNDDDDEDDD